MCFINPDLFLRSLASPESRQNVQPALIYAGLALATLIKSSELELGLAGVNRALWLRDVAQVELESSWSARWIDLGLAQAAMVCLLLLTYITAMGLYVRVGPRRFRVLGAQPIFARTRVECSRARRQDCLRVKPHSNR
jgi:hypothetical protein